MKVLRQPQPAAVPIHTWHIANRVFRIFLTAKQRGFLGVDIFKLHIAPQSYKDAQDGEGYYYGGPDHEFKSMADALVAILDGLEQDGAE